MAYLIGQATSDPVPLHAVMARLLRELLTEPTVKGLLAFGGALWAALIAAAPASHLMIVAAWAAFVIIDVALGSLKAIIARRFKWSTFWHGLFRLPLYFGIVLSAITVGIVIDSIRGAETDQASLVLGMMCHVFMLWTEFRSILRNFNDLTHGRVTKLISLLDMAAKAAEGLWSERARAQLAAAMAVGHPAGMPEEERQEVIEAAVHQLASEGSVPPGGRPGPVGPEGPQGRPGPPGRAGGAEGDDG